MTCIALRTIIMNNLMVTNNTGNYLVVSNTDVPWLNKAQIKYWKDVMSSHNC